MARLEIHEVTVSCASSCSPGDDCVPDDTPSEDCWPTSTERCNPEDLEG